MRKFEEFTGRATPASSKLMRVALQKRGTISLNRAAYLALGEPEAIAMLYDHESRAVGMKPISKDIRHAYPIRKQPNSKSYLIGAQAFCKYYDIQTGSNRAFAPLIEDGVLVFELDGGVDVAPRAPRNSKAKAKEPELAFK